MIKILNGYSWLEDELGEDTTEVKECLEKGLFKRIDEDSAKFIVLESNIPAVKDILKDDYNKLGEYTIIQWITDYFCGSYESMRIQNLYGDDVHVMIEQIRDLISDNEELYLSDDKKLEIYNAECPYDKMEEILNEIGRTQAKIQIQDLLNSIKDQKFR